MDPGEAYIGKASPGSDVFLRGCNGGETELQGNGDESGVELA